MHRQSAQTPYGHMDTLVMERIASFDMRDFYASPIKVNSDRQMRGETVKQVD